MREQAIDAHVTEPGDVEESEEPLERPHHVGGACWPPWRHLDHEPAYVVRSDGAESTPADAVEIGQELANLAGQQPHRSRGKLQASRHGELFQDVTGTIAECEIRVWAHHPPGHGAGCLELQHHAG